MCHTSHVARSSSPHLLPEPLPLHDPLPALVSSRNEIYTCESDVLRVLDVLCILAARRSRIDGQCDVDLLQSYWLASIVSCAPLLCKFWRCDEILEVILLLFQAIRVVVIVLSLFKRECE
jgi:hypothetical protein